MTVCILMVLCIDALLLAGLILLWLITCWNWGMPESTLCDICTLALFWLLQYLILLGYIVYTMTYVTGRELIYCANLALVHMNRTNE